MSKMNSKQNGKDEFGMDSSHGPSDRISLMELLADTIVSDSPRKQILKTELSSNMVLFTLYGDEIDKFMDKFLGVPAADMYKTSIIAVKGVFNGIFKEITRPKFNFLVGMKKELDFEEMVKTYGKSVPIDDLKKAWSSSSKKKIVKREIDAALLLNLEVLNLKGSSVKVTEKLVSKDESKRSSDEKDDSGGVMESQSKEKGEIDDRDYSLIEIKLFISPLEDPKRVLKRYLSNSELKKNFEYRHLFGLISFSFIYNHEEAMQNGTDGKINPNYYFPISKNDRIFNDHPEIMPNIWAIHLILMDSSILEKAKGRGRPPTKKRDIETKAGEIITKDVSDSTSESKEESKIITAEMRTDQVLEGILRDQRRIEERLGYPKEYKLGITNNLVKVVRLLQELKSYKVELEKLKDKVKILEEEKERERQEKERERQEKERERQEKERYLALLKKYGINPK